MDRGRDGMRSSNKESIMNQQHEALKLATWMQIKEIK